MSLFIFNYFNALSSHTIQIYRDKYTITHDNKIITVHRVGNTQQIAQCYDKCYSIFILIINCMKYLNI